VRAEVEFVRPPAGRSWRFHVRAEESFPFWWHSHDHYELTFIERGHGRRFAGNGVSAYYPGDLALFGPHLPHAYVSDEQDRPQVAGVAQFRGDVFGASLLEHEEFHALRAMLDASHCGLALSAEPSRLHSSMHSLAQLDGAEQTVALLDLLVWLARSADRRSLSTEPAGVASRSQSHAALSAAVQYLERNFRAPVTREEIAQAASVTPTSLSRLFRRQLGVTVTDYLSDLRLGAAAELLSHGRRSVADVAHSCGFANLANFNRQFRFRYGMTPRQYRRRFAMDAGGNGG
jgi:AraC-like DNA-binding protein